MRDLGLTVKVLNVQSEPFMVMPSFPLLSRAWRRDFYEMFHPQRS